MFRPKLTLFPGRRDAGGGRYEGLVSDRRLADLIADLEPIRSAADIRGLFASLASSVMNAVKGDACLVSLLDRDKGVLRDVAASVVPPHRLNLLAEEYDLADYPQTEWVLRTGSSVEISVSDQGADPGERRFVQEAGFARVLLTRLGVDGEGIGTIEVFRKKDRAFRQDDPQQIEVLAAFAASEHSRMLMALELEDHYTETIEALCSALEVRDPYTKAHTGRIRGTALALADAMKVPSDVRHAIRFGAILHDVGKIGISDAILRKPGPLNDDEWTAMRTHPQIGEQMLQGIDFLAPALPVIRHHHERWDGLGYPDGLSGEGIPLGARIVAACDAYDAMTTDRPYREALPSEVACEELLACAGTQFDPRCAELLVALISQAGDGLVEDRFIRYAS